MSDSSLPPGTPRSSYPTKLLENQSILDKKIAKRALREQMKVDVRMLRREQVFKEFKDDLDHYLVKHIINVSDNKIDQVPAERW
jgi:hypothetical protein